MYKEDRLPQNAKEGIIVFIDYFNYFSKHYCPDYYGIGTRIQ